MGGWFEIGKSFLKAKDHEKLAKFMDERDYIEKYDALVQNYNMLNEQIDNLRKSLKEAITSIPKNLLVLTVDKEYTDEECPYTNLRVYKYTNFEPLSNIIEGMLYQTLNYKPEKDK